MPKTLIAKNIASISNITFGVDGAGNVISFDVTCEVNYGEQGLTETLDIFPELTPPQKATVQNVYDAIKDKLEKLLIK